MAIDPQTLLERKSASSSDDRTAEFADSSRGLRRSAFCAALIKAAAVPRLRRFCLALCLRLEGGQFYSCSARRIMEKHYGVTIGAFSYGYCFQPGAFPPGVRVGRYVSIAPDVGIILRNHPINWLSTHPFFFNHKLGYVNYDRVPFGRLDIQHDAWIGYRATITPGCSRIGIGAIIGASAVVTRDVPNFAIVAGNPARIMKYRFKEDVQREILSSNWWNFSVHECVQFLEQLTKPLETAAVIHPLIQSFSNLGSRPDRG